MTVWALGDLHLAFSVPEKTMEAFKKGWIGYTDKIRTNWCTHVGADDLVLIPGDISWAMHPDQARIDLEWIHALPGTKVLLKGNHDYWWSSLSKVEKVLPPSMHLIQNNVFNWQGFSIGGTRLWDTPEYNFYPYRDTVVDPDSKKVPRKEAKDPIEEERIFERELARLEMSLKAFDPKAKMRIAMTHYAPIGAELHASRTSRILEKYRVDVCVFGHLHNLNNQLPMFGEKNGVRYLLTAADYLEFVPIKIAD